MLDENIKKFLASAGPIFFVTPTVGRAIGLEKELPDFHIVCAQRSGNIALLVEAGVPVFCAEKDVTNSGKLLAEAEVLEYIKRNSSGRKANILTFKPSPMIELICGKNGFNYLGNSSKLNRVFEDKVKFAEFTTELGIPNADSRTRKIERESLDELMAEFDFSGGKRYVIQFSRGYSGNSTHIIDDRERLRGILEENIGWKIKIADFKEGDTYTFDACIGDFGVLISQPIFQITGFPEFNRNALGTCGNDYAYGERLSGGIKDSLEMNIQKVADKLMQLGYRGILGFDFVVGPDRVDLIEVNPRLVGSIPVFTKLQLGAGEIPFLLLHILSFLDFDFRKFHVDRAEKDFGFAQLILRNTQAADQVVAKTLPGGVYKADGGGIRLERRAYAAEDSMAPDEFFLECADAGETIGPDMEYANIQFPYGIMETREDFTEDFSKIKAFCSENIKLN